MRCRADILALRSQGLAVIPQTVPVDSQSLNPASHVQFLYSQRLFVVSQSLSAMSQVLFSTSQPVAVASQRCELVVRWQPRHEGDTAFAMREGVCITQTVRFPRKPRAPETRMVRLQGGVAVTLWHRTTRSSQRVAVASHRGRCGMRDARFGMRGHVFGANRTFSRADTFATGRGAVFFCKHAAGASRIAHPASRIPLQPTTHTYDHQ